MITFPLNLEVFKNASTPASKTPTPTRPFESPSQLNSDRSSHAEARILIAAANITRPAAPEIILPLFLDSKLTDTTNSAINPPIPVRPTSS